MRTDRNSCATTACAAMILGVVLGAALGAGGCSSLNTDLAIGDDLMLPALVPDATLFDASVTPAGPVELPPPSVVALTRDNWAPVEFPVPNEWVEHRAVSSVHPEYTDAVIRRELHPTEETILRDEPSWERNSLQALEGVAAPFYSALDLIMTIPRAVVAHPWTVQVSPREAYERSPRALRPVVMAGEVEPEPEPEPAPAAAEPAPTPPDDDLGGGQ